MTRGSIISSSSSKSKIGVSKLVLLRSNNTSNYNETDDKYMAKAILIMLMKQKLLTTKIRRVIEERKWCRGNERNKRKYNKNCC